MLGKSDTTVHLTDPPARSVYLWSQADFDNIRQTIQDYCEEFIAEYNTSTTVNDLWNRFLGICNNMKLIPTKQMSTKHRCP